LQQKQSSEADFTSWYLRQVTKELEEDLDKIRSASDFKDSSLPVLINALQQGASLFSKEEKQRIIGSV
jgi:ribosome assembly protein 3